MSSIRDRIKMFEQQPAAAAAADSSATAAARSGGRNAAAAEKKPAAAAPAKPSAEGSAAGGAQAESGGKPTSPSSVQSRIAAFSGAAQPTGAAAPAQPAPSPKAAKEAPPADAPVSSVKSRLASLEASAAATAKPAKQNLTVDTAAAPAASQDNSDGKEAAGTPNVKARIASFRAASNGTSPDLPQPAPQPAPQPVAAAGSDGSPKTVAAQTSSPEAAASGGMSVKERLARLKAEQLVSPSPPTPKAAGTPKAAPPTPPPASAPPAKATAAGSSSAKATPPPEPVSSPAETTAAASKPRARGSIAALHKTLNLGNIDLAAALGGRPAPRPGVSPRASTRMSMDASAFDSSAAAVLDHQSQLSRPTVVGRRRPRTMAALDRSTMQQLLKVEEARIASEKSS